MQRIPVLAFLFATLVSPLFSAAATARDKPDGSPLPGTEQLTMEGDISSQLVDQADQFLLNQLKDVRDRRGKAYREQPADQWDTAAQVRRNRIAYLHGLNDPRVPNASLELVATTDSPSLVARTKTVEVSQVRWAVVGDIVAEGLLIAPKSGVVKGTVIALPDAAQSPEQLCGLVPGVAEESRFPLALAANGFRVIVPALISRTQVQRFPPERKSGPALTNREFIYRSAFDLGRHLIGYELQEIFALVDIYRGKSSDQPIGVIGYGEGGHLALLAGAIDPRIDVTCVSGYFGPREEIWNEPLDRNVFGLLNLAGDAELAALIHPRRLIIEAAQYPELSLPSNGGAPAELKRPTNEQIQSEWVRIVTGAESRKLVLAAGKPFAQQETVGEFVGHLKGTLSNAPEPLEVLRVPDAAIREQRLIHVMDRHNQAVLAESSYVRAKYMSKLDTSSVEKYVESSKPYREHFRNEVIGAFDLPLSTPKPRTRWTYSGDGWKGYEVVLDVFPGLFAYGVLLVPDDLRPGEKRPMVVCQHGLEGRPVDVFQADEKSIQYYHDFAAKLCQQGFITFAPQNLYIFKDRFRTLQRKANPMHKTLFSMIVPQHQQLVNWFKTLPMVDGNRIAFYGLSYGGKSAMRIPALVEDYCLSICSGDFNEWVAKNASTRLPFSYMWTGEYEIFEYDLGSTFNYAEMAALICPRPFMVERGHTDGVSVDELVSYEYAKVFYLYSHRLKRPDLCEMEVFDGPHTIHGVGTFNFLHRHLNHQGRRP